MISGNEHAKQDLGSDLGGSGFGHGTAWILPIVALLVAYHSGLLPENLIKLIRGRETASVSKSTEDDRKQEAEALGEASTCAPKDSETGEHFEAKENPSAETPKKKEKVVCRDNDFEFVKNLFPAIPFQKEKKITSKSKQFLTPDGFCEIDDQHFILKIEQWNPCLWAMLPRVVAHYVDFYRNLRTVAVFFFVVVFDELEEKEEARAKQLEEERANREELSERFAKRFRHKHPNVFLICVNRGNLPKSA